MATKIVPTFAAALADAKKNMIKAGIATVNIVAANARKSAQENITRSFTTRNNFTVNSVRFTQCPGSVTRLAGIRSETGITERAGYMARQETGGTRRNESGSNLIIPTTAARGGTNKGTVRRKFYYSAVRQNIVKGGTRFKSHKAAFVAQAAVANRTGKFVRRNDAVFQVSSFRAGGNVRFRLREVLNLKHRTTQTPQTQWLEPAAEAAARGLQSIFNSQMSRL